MSSVLITGANRGLGLEFARQYAAEGWDVIATARNPKQSKELEQVAKSENVSVQSLNVASDESVKALAATLDGAPIDLLILNSAIFTQDGNKFGALNFIGWRESFETNVLGAIRVAEALIENVAASEKKTDRGHQHRNGFAGDTGKHDRVWASISVQDKQGGFEHGNVDPSQRREATRNQRCDIQPRVGTNGYGRRERRVDAGTEYRRNAQSAAWRSDGIDGKIPEL